MCVMMMGMMMNRKYRGFWSKKVTIFNIHNYSRRFRLPRLYEKCHLPVNKKKALLLREAPLLERGGLQINNLRRRPFQDGSSRAFLPLLR
jgi:hypothetical protein